MSVSSWIEYLKDPYLVARFQAYFGVKNGYKKSNPIAKPSKTSREPFNFSTENVKLRDGISASTNGKVREFCDKGSDDSSGISSGGSTCDNDSSRSSSVSGSGNENDEDSSSGVDETVKRYVGNKLWYYLFLFGSGMGDEAFYACFFCFWFWNVDGAVIRRVVFVWAILMYIGQGLKDIIRWPRPSSPPVIRLERKWELEYGMPSTHAIVGAAVPFSIIIFTSSRYQYPVPLGLVLALLWCSLVCSSRIYLGMHTVLVDKPEIPNITSVGQNEMKRELECYKLKSWQTCNRPDAYVYSRVSVDRITVDLAGVYECVVTDRNGLSSSFRYENLEGDKEKVDHNMKKIDGMRFGGFVHVHIRGFIFAIIPIAIIVLIFLLTILCIWACPDNKEEYEEQLREQAEMRRIEKRRMTAAPTAVVSAAPSNTNSPEPPAKAVIRDEAESIMHQMAGGASESTALKRKASKKTTTTKGEKEKELKADEESVHSAPHKEAHHKKKKKHHPKP